MTRFSYRRIRYTLLLSFLTTCAGPGAAYAQLWAPSGTYGGTHNDAVTQTGIANVGIGLFYNHPNPVDKLTVGGDISLYPDLSSDRRIMGRTTAGTLNLYAGTSEQDGPGIRLYGRQHA